MGESFCRVGRKWEKIERKLEKIYLGWEKTRENGRNKRKFIQNWEKLRENGRKVIKVGRK